MIAIDIETYDSQLSDLGPGYLRGDGFLYMVGLYDGKDYVACRPDDPRLADWLASDEDKVFHNGIYDCGWLMLGKYHYKIGGTLHDTMTRCGLINEYMDLDLDTCCKKFGVKGKNYEDTIEKWFDSVKARYGIRGNIWDHLDLLVAMDDASLWPIMAKYNKQDCVATYQLYMETEKQMAPYMEPYALECELYPLWLDMKRIGTRIDIPRMDRLEAEIQRLKREQEKQLWYEYQVDGEVIASNKKMTAAMNRLGVKSPNMTATGQPSWDNKSLPIVDHPVATLIMNYKNLDYVGGKRGIGKIRAALVGDRVHCDFKPTKRDDGGTITARLASAHPNLQNIASREDSYGQKAWGPELRSLFLPEPGYMLAANDYGQIETRIMAHYAVGEHAEWFREQCRNPKVDMHALAMERTGIESRYIIKRINFGVPYGMGIKRMVNLDFPVFKKAADAHGDPDPWHYGDVLYQQFKTGFPVLFDMMANIQNIVRQQGYFTSIGGRRHHKPPAEQSISGKWQIPYYKMVALSIQGSAAEILKHGLRNALKAGVFNVLPMHLSVHDENVVSVPFNKEGAEANAELIKIMRDSYSERLTVPLTSSCELGPNWGYWKSDIWDEMQQGIFNPDAFQRVYAPKVKRSLWCIQNGYEGLDGKLNFIDEEKFSQ